MKPTELDGRWYVEGEEGEPYVYRPVRNAADGSIHVLKFHAPRTSPSESWVGGHIYNHTLCGIGSGKENWDKMDIVVVGTSITCKECAEKFSKIGVLLNKSMEVSLIINGHEWTCATNTHALGEIEEILKSGIYELTKGILVKDPSKNEVYEVKLQPRLCPIE